MMPADPPLNAETPPSGLPGSETPRINQLVSWWKNARDYQSANREQMAIDEDFVDGDQWTADDRQTMEARGQMPLVFNEIRVAVQWVLGTERRTRIDWKIIPREADDVTGAQIKTQLLKYLSDVNRMPFERSQAFAEAAQSGLGWLECGIRQDSSDEPLFIQAESWRNIWFDPMSRKLDLSDARYLFRSKVVDLDIACAMFPAHSERLRWESDHFNRLSWLNEDIELGGETRRNGDMRHEFLQDVYDTPRQVVRLIEGWYRTPESVQVLRGGPVNGQILDPTSRPHLTALDQGVASIYDAVRMVVRVGIFTMGGYLLADQPTPYRHNKFPFIPVWGYRKGRDNQPYGLARLTRDPQMDLNKRRSKALFALSTNKVIIEKDAVEDPELFEAEAARPDQIIWKKRGAEIQFLNNLQLADAHVQMGLQDGQFIREISGITAENLGLDSNAQSGKAILAKQQQGSVATATLFDNLRFATQLSGELMLSLVEQFYDAPKVIRVIGEKQQAEFVRINQVHPQTGEILNDITARQADFMVGEQDFRESYRQAMFETTLQMLSQQPPELAIKLLDLVFEFSDLPNKDELVKRIRQINGMSAPDDPNAEHQAQASAQQAQQAQQQAMMDKAQAETDLKRAQAEQARATAAKALTESQINVMQAAPSLLAGLLPPGGQLGPAMQPMPPMAQPDLSGGM